MSYRYYVRAFHFEKLGVNRSTDIPSNGRIIEVLGTTRVGDTTVVTALVEVSE